MTLEQLKRFCTRDLVRESILHPWTEGDWSFATDGWRIMMVPHVDGSVVPDSRTPRLTEHFLRRAQAITDWQPFSTIDSGEIECHFCQIVCPECEGKRTCSECGQGTHCQHCNDTGFVYNPPCRACNDTHEVSLWKFGDAHCDPYVLREIVRLPNLQFSPQREPIAPVWFRFDTGFACVMCVKV